MVMPNSLGRVQKRLSLRDQQELERLALDYISSIRLQSNIQVCERLLCERLERVLLNQHSSHTKTKLSIELGTKKSLLAVNVECVNLTPTQMEVKLLSVESISPARSCRQSSISSTSTRL